MIFPIGQVNTAKQAIQAMWGDRVTVLRSKEVDNVIELVPLYTDKPCHLSQSSQPVQKQSDTVAATASVFKLYVDTDVIIKQGDTLNIKHKAQLFTGVAGQPFERNISNVIPVEVVKIS